MRRPDDLAKPVTQTGAEVRADRSASGDLGLADACRRGELSAYETLYHVHGARLKRTALNLLGNVADAEDAVQEVFLKVYRSIGSFRGRSSFSTWIYRILLNCCRDAYRRKRRRQETSEQELEPERQDPVVTRTDHPLRLALESCLTRLTLAQREVFVLFEVEGLTHSEIAATLNISEASSKNILYEAKQHLRRLLSRSE